MHAPIQTSRSARGRLEPHILGPIAYSNTTGGVNIADVQFDQLGNGIIHVDQAADLVTLSKVSLSDLAAAQTATGPGGTTLDPIHFITSFH